MQRSRRILHVVLVVNWIAGIIALQMVLALYNSLYRADIRHTIEQEMRQDLRLDPDSEEWYPELNRRTTEEWRRFAPIWNLGFAGWVVALISSGVGIVGLIAAMPPKPRPAKLLVELPDPEE